MKISIAALVIIATAFISNLSLANVMTLPQLDPSNMDSLFKALANDMAYRSVEPGGDYATGGVFGFAAGLTGTQANTGSASGVTGTSTLPDANLAVDLFLPWGVAAEIGFLPNVSLNGTSYTRFGGELKWTLSGHLFEFPIFDIAARGTFASSQMSYSQPISGGNVNVAYNSTILGANIGISKKIFLLEPFASFGLISHNSTLAGTGTSSLYNGNFGGATTQSGTGSGTWTQLGLLLHLGFFGIAAEYDSMFSIDSYSAKLSFRI